MYARGVDIIGNELCNAAVMFRVEHPEVVTGRLGTGGFGPPKLNHIDITVLLTIAAIAPCNVKFTEIN